MVPRPLEVQVQVLLPRTRFDRLHVLPAAKNVDGDWRATPCLMLPQQLQQLCVPVKDYVLFQAVPVNLAGHSAYLVGYHPLPQTPLPMK